VPFIRAATLRTQTAIVPTTLLAAVGSSFVALEAGTPARIALYDPSTLTRTQSVGLRGTSATVLAVDDRTPDTVYVAGNYTAQFFYVQRFRLVGGILRETGYWLTEQTAVPIKMLASGSAVTLAIHDTNRNTYHLVRLNTANLFYEETDRITMPGMVSSIVNSDGVSGHVVIAGSLPSKSGYLLPVTYDPDRTVRAGTRVSLVKPLSTLCHTWRFVGAVPYARIVGADDGAVRDYLQDLNTGAITGPTTTSTSSHQMICPTNHPQFVVRYIPKTHTLQVLQPVGTKFQLRVSTVLPLIGGTPIQHVVFRSDTLIWSDGIHISSATVNWPR
jgi:hypothetical protein